MTDFELINGLLDSQLSPEDTAKAQDLLKGDPELRKHFDALSNLKSNLGDKCQGIHCEETWQNCRARLSEIDKADNATIYISRYAWQIAACLFLLIMSVGFYNRKIARIHPMEVAPIAADSSLIPQGIRDLFGGSAAASQNRLQLTGYGRGELQGHLVEKVTLRDSQGDMALFLIHEGGGMDGTYPSNIKNFEYTQVQNKNCVTWQQNGNSMMIVGDRSHEELQEVAQRIVPR